VVVVVALVCASCLLIPNAELLLVIPNPSPLTLNPSTFNLQPTTLQPSHYHQHAATNSEDLEKLAKAQGEVQLLKQKLVQLEAEKGEGSKVYETRIGEIEALYKEEHDKVFTLEATRRKLSNQVE